jgi:hypothetical protein
MDLQSINVPALFILYLTVSGNFIAELFGCKIQQSFTENMYMKHLLGIMTLYFFVIFAGGATTLSFSEQLKSVVILYTWFILTTKTKVNFTIVILLAFMGIYITQSQIKYYEEINDNNEHDERIKMLNMIYNALFVIAVLATLFGFTIYLGEKRYEYEHDWDWVKFVLGKPKCKFTVEGEHTDKTYLDYLAKGLFLK